MGETLTGIRDAVRAVLTVVLMITVGYALAAYGAARLIDQLIVGLALAGIALIAIVFLPWRPAAGWVEALVPAVGLLLVSIVIVQSEPIGADWPPFLAALEPPAWRAAEAALGLDLPATLSVAPGATRASLAPVAAAFLAFSVGLLVVADDREARRALGILVAIGLAVALFGLCQTAMEPRRLIFQERPGYIGTVTGTFVNRNTAASFFGVVIILLLAVTAGRLAARRYEVSFEGYWAALASRSGLAFGLAGLGLMLLVALSALGLTGSRMGLAATAGGLIVTVLLYRPLGRATWGRTFAGAAIVAGLAILAGQTAILRAIIQGSDDARWCLYEDVLRGIEASPIAGTGFGAFLEAFGPFRSEGCLTGLVVDRAHSVYLEAAFGLGVPAAALVTLAIAAAVIRSVAVGLGSRVRYRFAGAALAGIATLTVLHGLVDFSLQSTGFTIYLAVASAALVRLCHGRRDADAGDRLRSSVVFGRVAVAAIAITTIVGLRPILVAEAQTADLERLATAIESGRLPSDPILDRVADAAVLGNALSVCQPGALRAGITVLLHRVDRAPGDKHRVDQAATFVRSALECLPQEGMFWLRLAKLQSLASVGGDVRPLIGLSHRFTPADLAVVEDRAVFLATHQTGDPGGVLDHDLGIVSRHSAVARVVLLLDSLPPAVAIGLLGNIARAEPIRRERIQAEIARVRRRGG